MTQIGACAGTHPARLVWLGIGSSLALAGIKISTGVFGNSQALVADGIESLTDVVSSLAVLAGMALALRPPDRHHPWGYGKHETFAALFVSVALLAAVGLIAWQSISDILRPHDSPRWYTLPVLVGVVVVKIRISRTLSQAGKQHGSRALQADSWHHLSDALTSAAAFVGIVLALVGGEGWESADDWAALTACVVIIWNSLAMGHSALQELSESMVDVATERRLRRIGEQIEGVEAIEKMRARRSGRGILMDIHVQVDGNLTVTQGHHIAGCVKYALLQADEGVADVTVHIEPHGSGQQT